MTTNYNEQALEALIEKRLTGSCLEERRVEQNDLHQVSEERAQYLTASGYYFGSPSDFDKRYALDTVRFWDFLEVTQGEELKKLKVASDWKLKILERFDRKVKKDGILKLLKKGLEVDNAYFVLFYEAPSASSAQSTRDNFERNQFSVTRQIRYSAVNPGEEIDMVLFINGIPIITIELKNPWTGQTAASQGVNQYNIHEIIANRYFNLVAAWSILQ